MQRASLSTPANGATTGPTIDLRTAALIVVVSLAASLTGLLPGALNLYVAYGATVVVGVVLAFLLVDRPIVLAGAMVVAVAVGESGLVMTEGRNLPVLALAVPLVAAALFAIRERRQRLVWPPASVAVTAVIYLVVAGLSIVPSTLSGVRPAYPLVLLTTMTLGLLLALAVIPTLVQAPSARRSVLVVIAALGPALILSDVILWLTGPIPWAGSYVGNWIFDQLTIMGSPTPLIFLSPTGVFLRPASAATLLALSLIALLALRPTARGRWRAPLLLSIVADLAALVLTTNRDGWLLMAVGAGLLALLALWQRRIDPWAIATSVLLFGMLGLLTLNVVGANLRQDLAASRYGAVVANTLQGANFDVGEPVRGGATLSGRQYLWAASIDAVKQKPLTGWGLGTDQSAIADLLPPAGQHLSGFTSDSTWLVAAVERGLFGLASLVAFCAAALFALARRLLSGPARDLDPTTVAMSVAFVALLVGGTFETYTLGGLTFRSFDLALSAGLAAGVVGVAGTGTGRRGRPAAAITAPVPQNVRPLPIRRAAERDWGADDDQAAGGAL